MLFDGARVDAANMIGEPGEGWRARHDRRQPRARAGRARLRGPLRQARQRAGRPGRARPRPPSGPSNGATWPGRSSRPRCCGCHVCRRLSDRLDGITHGPEGSVDKLLMTWAEQAVGHAALSRRRRRPRRRRRHLAEGLPLQPGPERHGRHVADPAQPRRQPNPGAADHVSTYDLPDELAGRGRRARSASITLNRPEQLNATNHELHAGLAALFPQLDADDDARVVGAHRRRARLLGRRRLRLPRRAVHGRRAPAA